MELNIDQKRIIETKPNGHMLIKGVAGSGKTTVAIYKIPYLLNHYCLNNNDKVLVVTFTKTLINYINHIYNKMDKDITLFSFLNNSDNVEIKTIDSIIFSLFNRYKRKYNKNYKIIKPNDKYEFMRHAICIVSRKLPNQNIVNDSNIRFLLDEIEWIKSSKYIDIETYQNIDRKGRGSSSEKDGTHRLLKNSENRKAIFYLMKVYDKIMKDKNLIDFETIALEVLAVINKNAIKIPKYTHIIIDESQDLTRVQLEILAKLYNEKKSYSSIVFIADTSQSIYSHSWLSYRTFKSIGFDMSGRSRILSKNYRTTTQIAKAAYSLIENDENITSNENYVKPSVIERNGEYPLYKRFQSDEQELKFICREIKNKLYKKYDLKDIAIIARTRVQLDNAERYLKRNGIDARILNKKNDEFDKDCIKLLTIHSIKGLEFKVVIIIGLNSGIIPIESKDTIEDKKDIESVERKLLYVGMTRAKEELYLSSSAEPSKFIGEIDSKYLKTNNTNFSKLNHIGIENYKFKHKILDIYSREEVVRQWIISQLHEKLNYPYEMMDIEYKVKLFSRTGYVDIVIFDYKNGTKTPFIFIEVKQPNEDINSAIKQIETYMYTTMCVKYGLVTNGEDIKIIKRNKNEFEFINSLPTFKGTLGKIEEEFTYIDFRHGKNYKIHRNVEDKNTITLYNQNNETAYDIDKYHELKVYGNIAAGKLKLAVEEFTGEFTFPENLLYDSDNCFMLKVTGDSMINAGIDIGDYVIVHKQNYAENLDIIAAVVGNEATLKKFTTMGSKILLMPENKAYEPIMVDESDLIINGKVIGVLKI